MVIQILGLGVGLVTYRDPEICIGIKTFWIETENGIGIILLKQNVMYWKCIELKKAELVNHIMYC